jgi:phospholipase/lecithinase/hemolysin
MNNSTLKRKIPRPAFCARALAIMAAALAICVAQVPAWANSTPFSEIVVFGDSVSDNGNFYQMSIATWGPEWAYPPPPYWEGRFSNGPVWPEYLAPDLGMAGLLEDYAVGGATSGTECNGAPFGGVQNQLVRYFSAHNRCDPNALYIVWVGHNDIFIPFEKYPNPDQMPELLAALDAARVAFVANMKSNIKTLWDKGARNIMVVNILDVGPVTPSFNEGLASVLKDLATKGVPTIAVDVFAEEHYVVAHPAEFGFVNVTDDPFPNNPPGYAWFGGHPSTDYHKIIAQFMVRNLIDYYSPRNGHSYPPALVNALNGLVKKNK